VILNILFFDIFLAKAFNPLSTLAAVLAVFLVWVYRERFALSFAAETRNRWQCFVHLKLLVRPLASGQNLTPFSLPPKNSSLYSPRRQTNQSRSPYQINRMKILLTTLASSTLALSTVFAGTPAYDSYTPQRMERDSNRFYVALFGGVNVSADC
jgi:hypothetical protein